MSVATSSQLFATTLLGDTMSFLAKLLALFTPDTSSRLAPIEVKQLLALPPAERPLLVDVRTASEWKQGHIAGSKNIDITGGEFDRKIQGIAKDASILLYCRSGGRSGSALSRMKSQGYQNVKHLAGGIGSWQAAGYPLKK